MAFSMARKCEKFPDERRRHTERDKNKMVRNSCEIPKYKMPYLGKLQINKKQQELTEKEKN